MLHPSATMWWLYDASGNVIQFVGATTEAISNIGQLPFSGAMHAEYGLRGGVGEILARSSSRVTFAQQMRPPTAPYHELPLEF
jgi:hypothetical protein